MIPPLLLLLLLCLTERATIRRGGRVATQARVDSRRTERQTAEREERHERHAQQEERARRSDHRSRETSVKYYQIEAF